MQIDWWTLAFQTINLLVLVWILSRFLFRPIADIIRQRQAEADALLEQAESRRDQAEREQKEAEDDKQETEQARGNVLQSAAKEAEAQKAQILDRAHKEADELRDAAKREIDKLCEVEKQKADQRASALAIEIARKLFDRLPEEAKIIGFVDGLAQAVAKLPEYTRNEIGADGKGITVIAARKLSDSEAATLQRALVKALGRSVTISVRADAGVIAGLEIEAPHAIIRNSFRADLDRIAAELAGRDND